MNDNTITAETDDAYNQGFKLSYAKGFEYGYSDCTQAFKIETSMDDDLYWNGARDGLKKLVWDRFVAEQK